MRCYVVGNIAVDETFAVDDLPARGASILGREVSRDLGGKGANQAVVLARCGLSVLLVAGLGTDSRARWIEAELAVEGLARHAEPSFEGASDLSIVLAARNGDNAIVTTTDAAASLTAEIAASALAEARPGDLLLLQGNLSVELTRTVLEAGRRHGMLTAFNPSPVKPGFAALWPLVDIAILNAGEARELTGEDDAETAARAILAAGSRQAAVTLGHAGALFAGAGGVVRVPAEPASVVETTGAGDTFTGVALASALLRGVRLDRAAIEAGTRAAALTIARYGTRRAFPSREELARILAH